MARGAGFGNAHDQKNLFKINDLPQMAQMAGQKWQEKKKESEKECNWNVNEPYRNVNQKVAKLTKR